MVQELSSTKFSKDKERIHICKGLFDGESWEDCQSWAHETHCDKNKKRSLIGSFDVRSDGRRHKKRAKKCKNTEINEFIKFKYTCKRELNHCIEGC